MGRYHFPVVLLGTRIPSFVLGQKRSLLEDTRLLFGAVGAKPRVTHSDRVPASGPFVVVMNHYHRSDIPSWWPALAIFQATAEHMAQPGTARIRFIIASQWTFEGSPLRFILEPVTRFMVGRVARAYDFLTIEPVALGAASSAGRAQSMRHILAALHASFQTRDILCLAPEGGDTPHGALINPPAGAGRFMILCGSTGLTFLPAGAFALDDELVVNFGEPFLLRPPAGMAKRAADEWASSEVMGRIAALLPAELRGAYGDCHEATGVR